MQRIERTRLWDLAVLLSAAVLIGSYCYFVTRHRIFWSDELFGWELVTDPSWSHMIRAWNLGADGGGIGFYVLCRLWLTLFGKQLLAFRAFSATGIFIGFAATWFSVRRFYRPEITMMALSAVWFGSHTLLWHILQTRFYGLLVGMVGCALYMAIRTADEFDATGTITSASLAWTFVVNLVLVSTHPFGFVYCGVILSAAFVNDLLSKRRRVKYYAAAALSWTVLLFSRTALESSARVGKPWFWTTRPTGLDLLLAYEPDLLQSFSILMATALFVVLASLLWKQQRKEILAGLVSRREILIPGLFLFLTPVLFWFVSLSRTSYFVDRYFLPFTIGNVILGAELLTCIFSRRFSLDEPKTLLFAVALCVYVWHDVVFDCMLPFGRTVPIPPRDFTVQIAAMLPRNEPIVIQRADIFDLMVYYRGAPDLPMYSPLDWDLALSPRSPRWLVSAMHEMENWKQAGYYSDHIVDSKGFLQTHSKFVVIEDNDTPWFHDRIETQPGWHLRKLGRYENGIFTSTIWEVTR